MNEDQINQLFEEWTKLNPDQRWDVPQSFAKFCLERVPERSVPLDMKFIQWYSGMKPYQILKAFERYKRDTDPQQLTETSITKGQ
jgi:hypothetical protein